MGEGGRVGGSGGVRTTERLTSTQTSHAAAVWLPAQTANCHFAIGDACPQLSAVICTRSITFLLLSPHFGAVQPSDNSNEITVNIKRQTPHIVVCSDSAVQPPPPLVSVPLLPLYFL